MLHCNFGPSAATAVRPIASAARCPHCGDRMVAPTLSEFVEGDEVRHHWVCETCAQTSVTSFALTTS